jgi:hypothetical protein
VLLLKVLDECPHKLDQETTTRIQQYTPGEDVWGYVELDWCLENKTSSINSTRFYVTKTVYPPYDVVLGTRDVGIVWNVRTKDRK